MTRVRLVMRPSVINQPVSVVAELVNARLRQMGLTPVDERTIRRDIERGLELYRERVSGGAEWYRAQFQAQLAETMLDLEAVPRGKDRAPLRAVAIRLLEDMARIDGVWQNAAVEAEQRESAWDLGDVPDAQGLVEAGEITHEQLSAYLLVLHRGTGGIAPNAGSLPASAEVIDAEPAPGRRTPMAAPRTSAGGGARGVPGTGPMGDEISDVVDWVPFDEED